VPKREQAAHFLGMSERTLARRLLAQHTSYETLLDSVRQQKAIEAVEQSSERLADIALALGFAESSTFYRAFKRWTGVAPAQWRQRYAKGPL
jgi:AraC-like DNA-binding protein